MHVHCSPLSVLNSESDAAEEKLYSPESNTTTSPLPTKQQAVGATKNDGKPDDSGAPDVGSVPEKKTSAERDRKVGSTTAVADAYRVISLFF